MNDETKAPQEQPQEPSKAVSLSIGGDVDTLAMEGDIDKSTGKTVIEGDMSGNISQTYEGGVDPWQAAKESVEDEAQKAMIQELEDMSLIDEPNETRVQQIFGVITNPTTKGLIKAAISGAKQGGLTGAGAALIEKFLD